MKTPASDHILRKAENKRLRLLEKSEKEKNAVYKEYRLRETLSNSSVQLLRRDPFCKINCGDKFVGLKQIAPRVFEFETIHPGAFNNLSQLDWERSIDDWKPHGKSAVSLFYSLVEHLLARYPMPSFLWSGLWAPQGLTLSLIIEHVAHGNSIFDLVKSGMFPVPFTRKMCHELMQTKGRIPFMEAVRRIQIKALDGSTRLADIVCGLHQGKTLHSPKDEEFYHSCFAWFASNPMLDPAQISPLFDFIEHCRRGDINFSMKGRSPNTFLRAMAEWHGHLSKVRGNAETWVPTGFKAYFKEHKGRDANGNHFTESFRIEEIVSAKALAEEGRALGHCVYSYVYDIKRGRVSIWSMSRVDVLQQRERMVTIELLNDNRKICQVRGKHNRRPTQQEHEMLCAWASEANLMVGSYV